MNGLGYLVVSVAAYRLTHLFTSDSITGPWRHWLHDLAIDRRSNLLARVYELATCTYCLGVWVSAAVYLFAVWVTGVAAAETWGWHTLSIFAVAGAVMLVTAAVGPYRDDDWDRLEEDEHGP